MNPKENLVIAKNKIITEDIKSLAYNKKTQKYDVTFKTGQSYRYNFDNIVWIRDPIKYNPENYQVSKDGRVFIGIESIYLFSFKFTKYWYVAFKNNKGKNYAYREIKVKESCLNEKSSKDVFDYLKETTRFSELKDDNGENILEKKYEKMTFIDNDTVLANYLNPEKYYFKENEEKNPIFPFGCNKSQFKAVKNAIENKISVIEGPPGTGKTQTILNIIANLLIEGKTVEVVSNNNSAIENIFEKLSDVKYGMDFIVAPLGKMENKSTFINMQTGEYPDLTSWKNDRISNDTFFKEIREQSEHLEVIFHKQERVARLRQELQALKIEKKHYEKGEFSLYNGVAFRKRRRAIRSDNIMDIWNCLQDFAERRKKISFFLKVKLCIVYGLYDWKFYRKEPDEMILEFQKLYYTQKEKELQNELEELQTELSQEKAEKVIENFTESSLAYLKNVLHEKYGTKEKRTIFTEEALYKFPQEVQKEYPVILSTTFSATSSLGRNTVFDYVIMDEASQVDLTTGALSLSCAKNAVIVGDRNQLPNIIKREQKQNLDNLFKKYSIHQAYDFTKNSFLDSVCQRLKNVPCTLLKEHYRCHPKIINFCNQKFYGGELIIMTEDKNEDDVLMVMKTSEGNHARGHLNQREIDVICNELLPELDKNKDVGIIAPYKKQSSELKHNINDESIAIATVHKFQGREKDSIILTTVDNEVTEFTDDPYLLNVAVSRAKNNFYLVVSGNEQPKDSNIRDLILYIEYNNFTVTESKIHSIFDYLYTQYSESRFEFLKKHKRISEYDSENLMYGLIGDTLAEEGYKELGVLCHQPLNTLIRDLTILTEAESRYALNPATHLDFLIYNHVTKTPILAIEVDGWTYHKKETVQGKRDELKNIILDKYELPYLRFSTNGSNEKEILVRKLKHVME